MVFNLGSLMLFDEGVSVEGGFSLVPLVMCSVG